jgi:hypothetical protein
MTRLPFILALAVTPVLFASNAAFACKSAPHSPLCQVGQENCEETCITTSDGGPGRDNQYIDGRKQQFDRFQYYRERGRRAREAAEAEGRRAWANNGTPSSVGMISPFVPGSTQDLAWRAERQRHGMR